MALDFVNQLKENLGKERDAELRAQRGGLTMRDFQVFQDWKGRFRVRCKSKGLVNGRRFKTKQAAQLFADRCEAVLAPNEISLYADGSVPALAYKEGA
jgi:hypothetical protein